jgi:LacI family transcriptional regulator
LKVTIKDLARIANVSPSTVSRALAGSPRISEATRRQIHDLAKNFNYSPNSLARGLVTRRSNLMGLLVPDIANPFFSEWAQAAENEATRHGYAIILASTMRTNSQEDLKIRSLLELRVAGILLCSLNVRNPSVIGLANLDVPAVYCDVDVPGVDKAYLVHSNDVLGARLATSHLSGLGRRNICHIAGSDDTLVTEYRLRGYRDALDAAGLPHEARRVVHTEYGERGGYQAMLRLLDDNPNIDAVFAANDLIAIGAMEAIAQRGLDVPRDIAVVGYDDIRLASLVRPRLTTVRQSAQEMGAQGMRMLLSALQDGLRPPHSVEIQPTLVVRDSCGSTDGGEVEVG